MGNFLKVSCYIWFPTKWGTTFFFISSRIPHFAGFQAFPILQDSINLFEQISCKMGNCYTRLNIAFPILQDFKKIPQFEGFNCSDFYKVGNYIFFYFIKNSPLCWISSIPYLLDFKKIPQFEGLVISSKATKWGLFQSLFKYHKFKFREFPILQDFTKIPQFEGLVISSKATKWGIFQRLFKYHRFKFPILQDFMKIPQFEGLVISSKATKWGIFQRLFKYHRFKFPILQDFMKIPQFEGLVISSKATKWGIFQGLLKKEKDPISLNNCKRTLNDQTQIGELKSYA